MRCRRISCAREPFLDLSLSIPIQEKPPEPTPAEAMRAARSKAPPPPPPPVTTLEDCLSAFQAKEDLVGDDAYECEACAKDDAAAAQEGAPPSPTMRQRALKVLHVSKSPPVLTLHVKRFAAINGAMHKVDERVRFPSSVHVDMFPDAATSLEQLSAGAGLPRCGTSSTASSSTRFVPRRPLHRVHPRRRPELVAPLQRLEGERGDGGGGAGGAGLPRLLAAPPPLAGAMPSRWPY